MLQIMAGAARSWSRAGLVLTLYLALASAGVAWSSLRGDSSTWRLAGRGDTQTMLGIVAGILIGLGYVFASRLAVHRFEWARALHRDMRAMLGPLPDAEVVVHPECPEEICDVADAVMSTAQMIRYCQASSKKTFIIGTEMGLMHRLRKLMPEKTFIQASKTLLCPNMKLTQLEDVYTALKEMKHVIEVPEDIRVKAHQALDAMMSMIPSK